MAGNKMGLDLAWRPVKINIVGGKLAMREGMGRGKRKVNKGIDGVAVLKRLNCLEEVERVRRCWREKGSLEGQNVLEKLQSRCAACTTLGTDINCA
jgi:hypothetical protein